VKRSTILLLAMLLGLAVAPFPQPPAAASCAAPSLEAPRRLVLERGARTTVEGRGFVDGCQDSMGCTVALGCSHCEYDEPTPRPLKDVPLRLRQRDRTWWLGITDAEAAGRVSWRFDLPARVRPGPATLLPGDGEPLRVRVR
jgi:hypothetical protein